MTPEQRARLRWLCTEPDPWPEDSEAEEPEAPPDPLSPEVEARLLATMQALERPRWHPLRWRWWVAEGLRSLRRSWREWRRP